MWFDVSRAFCISTYVFGDVARQFDGVLLHCGVYHWQVPIGQAFRPFCILIPFLLLLLLLLLPMRLWLVHWRCSRCSFYVKCCHDVGHSMLFASLLMFCEDFLICTFYAKTEMLEAIGSIAFRMEMLFKSTTISK